MKVYIKSISEFLVCVKVLPLQSEMKKPEQFQQPLGVLNVGMVIVTFFYLLVGMVGYLKYGDEVMGSVTLNLPQDNM